MTAPEIPQPTTRPLRKEISRENLLGILGKESVETEIRNIQYFPPILSPPEGLLNFQVKGKNFENVSLSYTRISNFVFTKCTFRRTEFVECRFIECEFHDCKFEDCNLWKVKFYQTYIDPVVFIGLYDRVMDANKGVGLFHSLLYNSADTLQPEFEVTARYHFYKWQRFQLEYERKKQNWWNKIITTFRIWWNVAKEWTIGYGLKLKNFFGTSAILYSLATVINYEFWGNFSMRNANASDSQFIDSAYFTIVTLLTVGFGDVFPTSSVGRGVIAIEAVLSVLWLGLLTGILVRKVIK